MKLPKICRLCLIRPVCSAICDDFITFTGSKFRRNNIIFTVSIPSIVICEAFVFLKIFTPYFVSLLIFFILSLGFALISSKIYSKRISTLLAKLQKADKSLFVKLVRTDGVPKKLNWIKYHGHH